MARPDDPTRAHARDTRLTPGTRVSYPFFTHNVIGTVTRDNGGAVLWVRDAEGMSERWIFRDSITTTDPATPAD